MIIGLAGPTAGGKTTVAKHLETVYKNQGVIRIKASDILLEIATGQNISPTKHNLQKLSTELREQHGEDFLSEKVKQRVIESPSAVIIVEGNRRLVDITALEEMATVRQDTLVLIFIDASVEERFKRYTSREGERVSFLQFQELENDECEKELPQLREYFRENGAVIDTTHMEMESVLKEAELLSANPN